MTSNARSIVETSGSGFAIVDEQDSLRIRGSADELSGFYLTSATTNSRI
jgi:hypothetical protein